jgi:hypothetical protein
MKVLADGSTFMLNKEACKFFAVKTSLQEGCKSCSPFQKSPCTCHNAYIHSVFQALLARSTMPHFFASIYAVRKNTKNYGHDPIRLSRQNIPESKKCFPLFMIVKVITTVVKVWLIKLYKYIVFKENIKKFSYQKIYLTKNKRVNLYYQMLIKLSVNNLRMFIKRLKYAEIQIDQT